VDTEMGYLSMEVVRIRRENLASLLKNAKYHEVFIRASGEI